MKEYNCIVIFDDKLENVLFCKRQKDLYKGLYNFVGGETEPGESSIDVAYRELFEETGLTSEKIRLSYFMEMKYDLLNYFLKLFSGMINKDEPLVEEINPLLWLPIDQRYEDINLFAGDQNIGHIIRMANRFINRGKHGLKYC